MGKPQDKPTQASLNGAKPKQGDSTLHNISEETLNALLLNYAQGKSTQEQQLVNVTIKKGGKGATIETMDAVKK